MGIRTRSQLHFGLVKVGKKLKLQKSKEKRWDRGRRRIELRSCNLFFVWCVFLKRKGSWQTWKDVFLGMYASGLLNLRSLAMWSHAIYTSRSVFFQEPLAVRDVSANGTGLQHSGLDEIFWWFSGWILQREKFIDVSSYQVGDVKGNATLIIFSTMPWPSVHTAMPWP